MIKVLGKLLIHLFVIFHHHRTYINITCISLLFFFTVFSIVSYLNDKTHLVFISIFLLIFITNFYLFVFTFKVNNKRSIILSLISSRNKVLNNTNLIGAEIGVHRGDYSQKIFNFFKNKKFNLEIYLIDQWIVDDDFKEYNSQNLELAYQHVVERFKDNQNIKVIKSDSLNASLKFSDNYFDFIYVDANHDYKFVLEDLKLWFPKLKNKGILFGDDYNRPYGVSKAVAEFSHENKLTVHLSDNDSQYYLIKE